MYTSGRGSLPMEPLAKDLCINLLLTILGYIADIIHAVFVL